MYEAWVDGRASLRFGLYDLNSEFDTSEAGSLFLLSSHGVGPDLGQSGDNGPSIFPVTSLGLRSEYRLGERWLVRAAVLDGVPGDPDRPRRTAIRLGKGEGALVVGEVNHLTEGMKIAAGAWAYTSRFAGVASPRRRADNRGAYLLVERRLSGTDTAALAGFVRVGAAQDRVNPIGRYVGGGLVRTGLLRGDDRLGFGVARAVFGVPYRRELADAGGRSERAETIAELTYRTPLSPWLTIQPDVQYVMNPGGDPGVRDALVLGLRAEVGF